MAATKTAYCLKIFYPAQFQDPTWSDAVGLSHLKISFIRNFLLIIGNKKNEVEVAVSVICSYQIPWKSVSSFTSLKGATDTGSTRRPPPFPILIPTQQMVRRWRENLTFMNLFSYFIFIKMFYVGVTQVEGCRVKFRVTWSLRKKVKKKRERRKRM
jgi:hypothetical protein